MSVTSAINNLLSSIIDIFAAIVNSVLALLQTAFAAVYGLVSALTATVHGIVGLLWNNIGILLVAGFAILGYQIFVVDKGRTNTHRVGGGSKKLK